MLKENQFIKIKWSSSNKNHFISKGYNFTKIYDEFTVKVEDLSNGSKVKVVCYCDYCGKEIIKPYNEHISRGDCCTDCRYIKVEENNIKKYGVKNPSQLQEIKDKTKQTNLERYGCTCTVHNKDVQEKVKQTNIERYGSEYYFGSETGKQVIQNIIDNRSQEEKDAIKNKRENTCLERYGVKNVFELDEFQKKVIETNIKKYNVPYAIMNENIRVKQIDSMINNHNNRTSKQEQKCYSIIRNNYNNCLSSVRCGKYTLDCVLNYQGVLINIEYDGWYWHQNMQEYDNERNIYVAKNGYKIIRILSEGKMPTVTQLQNAIDDIIINNKDIVYIDIRNHTQS